ncbi:hypothetical protein [Candidatus Nitrotoga arctica]|uniref:Uncharacterized protein n=1 Tax=Candidatus Nitrotoga arctica TaxID=453162 RepID=A0ABN8ANS5_9PROT|nr:hypothetical protein [Candidatus Nitrotoga arctica]CAG9932408.1 conserved protein of unknown function [Candidatus Nitrotoga arctica]
MTEQTRIGKLTIHHIQHLIQFVPILEQIKPDLAEKLILHPDNAVEFWKPGLAWGDYYDLSITQHIACFLMIAGLADYVIAAAQSSDPTSEMMKLDDHPDYQEWNGGAEKLFEYHKLLGALYALVGSLECLVLYGYYINEYIAISAEQNDDTALFNAIRIDPVVLTCKTSSHRISRAVVEADTAFFHGLQNALNGKTGSQASYLKKFKLLMQILLEQNLLNEPISELKKLCLELEVYADNPSAEKNLDELIRKFRKKQTISK